jgi:hypothetical protein
MKLKERKPAGVGVAFLVLGLVRACDLRQTPRALNASSVNRIIRESCQHPGSTPIRFLHTHAIELADEYTTAEMKRFS